MDLLYILSGPVGRMSHVTRYSSIPVHRRENVAEHSWWVSFIAMLICDDLLNEGVEVFKGEVLQRAIVHDLDECISGDIIRSFKYRTESMRLAMHDASTENMKEITSKMSKVGAGVYDHWHDAKDNTLEGDVVRFADMVTVVAYCREEYISGNRHIARVLHEMYTTWFHEWHFHKKLGPYADRLFPRRLYTDALEHYDPSPKGDQAKREGLNPIQGDASEGPTAVVDDWPMPSGVS